MLITYRYHVEVMIHWRERERERERERVYLSIDNRIDISTNWGEEEAAR